MINVLNSTVTDAFFWGERERERNKIEKEKRPENK